MNPITSDMLVRILTDEAAANLTRRDAALQIPTTPGLIERAAKRIGQSLHQLVDPRSYAMTHLPETIATPTANETTLAPLVTLEPAAPITLDRAA